MTFFSSLAEIACAFNGQDIFELSQSHADSGFGVDKVHQHFPKLSSPAQEQFGITHPGIIRQTAGFSLP
jgi:hypothetical protein